MFYSLSRSRERSPFGVSSWNGMNLRKSVDDPNSRLSRIVNYIRQNGMSEKKTIFRDVFGKTIVKDVPSRFNPSTGKWEPSEFVGRNWGTYVWNLAVSGRVLVKIRKGNRVFYDLGVNSSRVV